jgi:hypothetical protein
VDIEAKLVLTIRVRVTLKNQLEQNRYRIRNENKKRDWQRKPLRVFFRHPCNFVAIRSFHFHKSETLQNWKDKYPSAHSEGCDCSGR